MTASADKHIAQRILDGNMDCFARIVERYGGSVFSTILRITGDREEAEELTQDVFMKVLRSIGRYRGESSLATWIYRIAYNQAISGVRKSARQRRMRAEENVLDRLPAEDGDDPMLNEQRLVALEQSLQQLPTDEAMLITLFYYQEKSVAELAAITGLSESNVKVKLHRIRKKIQLSLRELLEVMGLKE